MEAKDTEIDRQHAAGATNTEGISAFNTNRRAQLIFPCYKNWWVFFPFLQTEVQQQLTDRNAEVNRLQREVRELRVCNDTYVSIQLV